MESDVDLGVEEELRRGKKSEEIRVKSELCKGYAHKFVNN